MRAEAEAGARRDAWRPALVSWPWRAHRRTGPARLDNLEGGGANPSGFPFLKEASRMLLKDKVAIVTGAGRGIGKEEALLMAKLGAKVVVNDLGAHFDGTGAPTATPAQEVVTEIKKMGGDVVANGDNVADFKAAKNIVDTAIKTFGKLNIIVNNAGILRDRMIFNMDEESWDSVVAVHLKGTFNMARHACEYWREEHKKGNVLNGRIIN